MNISNKLEELLVQWKTRLNKLEHAADREQWSSTNSDQARELDYCIEDLTNLIKESE
jgi:hypothetical protein